MSRPDRLRRDQGRSQADPRLHIPVLGGVEFGHAGPNLPMPVGIRVALDAQQRTLSLLELAVHRLEGGPDRR
ncbi:hypothetical protein [Streptomyces sp. NPDC058657]|uniref:hypothetical protein n=1 Tax=unclassified Streptomyces TaxID=2593676 RepID=UPI00364C3618